MTLSTASSQQARGNALWPIVVLGGLAVAGILVWQAVTAAGNPNPLAPDTDGWAAILDIGVLVFREGLECVLVLAAITAGTKTKGALAHDPIAIGVAAGFVATLATWVIAIHILNDLGHSVSALALQAATGLLAVIVLLVVMNWFFHKLYWTGWISLHAKRKRELDVEAADGQASQRGVFWGLILLGFTSFYREGFEVVLFLQSYRLQLGDRAVLCGVCLGLSLSGIVAILTFVAHRKLPYRRMLVLTGVLLGIVLVAMVGEQAQEMQLAHWISTTRIPWLVHFFPAWVGLWFSIFPTLETLLAQAIATSLVFGSYIVASGRRHSG